MSNAPRELNQDYANFPNLLPAESYEYFDRLNQQHFNPDTAIGSRFNDPRISSVADLLTMAQMQRSGLEGDDKQQFIELGVAPEALLPQCRYILVKEVKGLSAIAKVDSLNLDRKVKVIRAKPLAPCSLVIEIDDEEQLPQVDIATIIIGPNEENEPTTQEMLWTAHPGLPVRPTLGISLEGGDVWPEGSEITVADVVNKFGNEAYLSIAVKNK